jgi:hypothetical protein
MAKAEIQRVFRVPVDKVLEYYGNHELYNSVHTSADTTYTIVSRRDNEVLVDVNQDIKGQKMSFRNKTVYHLPRRIETETLSGLAKGSTQKITFESVAEGTKVTYTTDFKLALGGMAGKAFGLMSNKMMKKMTKEAMEEAADLDRKHLEGEQPQPLAPQ